MSLCVSPRAKRRVQLLGLAATILIVCGLRAGRARGRRPEPMRAGRLGQRDRLAERSDRTPTARARTTEHTTATVEPLSSVNVGALGLEHAGRPDRRHAVGRPAERLRQSHRPIQRLRQPAVARHRRQAGPASPLRQHGFLRAARPGGVPALRRRLGVGESHRRAASHRRVYQRLRLRLLLAGGAARLGDPQIQRSRRRPAHRRGPGHRRGVVRRRHLAPATGEVSRLRHRVRQPQDPPDRRVGGAGNAGSRP